jgi:hypothetical protein
MKLKKILFSLILLFSFNAEAKYIEYYTQILNTVKLYCRPDQYFNPKSKTLIGSILELPVIGMCETDRESFFKIYFDIAYWNDASEDYRYELMAHEIMHCFFFMDHVENNKDFMYYQIRDLTKEQTKQQLIDHLQVLCK